jgi:hypothetical protein
MNTQNFLDIGKWIVDFLYGQIYGWPISFITIIIGKILFGDSSSKL